jgi:hypothetical protein
MAEEKSETIFEFVGDAEGCGKDGVDALIYVVASDSEVTQGSLMSAALDILRGMLPTEIKGEGDGKMVVTFNNVLAMGQENTRIPLGRIDACRVLTAIERRVSALRKQEGSKAPHLAETVE